MLGHNVTAVDIEDRYCELVQRRSELLKVDVDIVNSDFCGGTNREEVRRNCIFRVLPSLLGIPTPPQIPASRDKAGGKIYFGAEPINEQFVIPWGTRLDGEFLFVARRCGWMELGFHSDFFAELLSRTGWRGRCVSPHFWVATSAAEPAEPIVIEANDLRLGTMVGTRVMARFLHRVRRAARGARIRHIRPLRAPRRWRLRHRD